MKSQIRPRNVAVRHRLLLLFVATSTAIFGMMRPAAAAGVTMPWDGPLDRIVDNLTGPFALAVGVLGLVVLAVRILFGEQFGQFARSIINVIIAVAMITGGAGLLRALIPNASGASYVIDATSVPPADSDS